METSGIVPYEDLNVTTMTVLVSLIGTINRETAFNLLPIIKIDMPVRKSYSSKCKLPHCSKPGSILSMSYRHKRRGIIKTEAAAFRNSCTLEISLQTKNVNVKLSPKSLYITGARSKDHGYETATYIMTYLKQAQNIIEKIKHERPLMDEIVEWVIKNTKGPAISRRTETVTASGVTLVIHKEDNLLSYPLTAPIEMDYEILSVLLDMMGDFEHHSEYCKKLKYLYEVSNVISPDLGIASVEEVMVNYNYSLGFEVMRDALSDHMNTEPGFSASFNKDLVTYVLIEVQYTTDKTSKIQRRKNKIPHHSILVYRSGSVTQSGPNKESVQKVYYEFMNIIQKIAPQIKQVSTDTKTHSQCQYMQSISSEMESSE